MLFSATLLAQNFNKDLEGKMVPAKMIFGDGIPQEIEMKYQAPEFYKNQFNKFTIRPSFQDEPYTHSGGIEAFMVEGNIWALRPNLIRKTEFVVMGIQGAIERYTYIKYDRKPGTDDENFAIIGSRFGTITHKVGTNDYIEGEVPNEIVKKWISDSPEVLEELNKAETEANEEKEKQRLERIRRANKNRSSKNRRTWNYVKAIRDHYFPEKPLKEIRTSLKNHRQGLETDIPDVAWRNPSP